MYTTDPHHRCNAIDPPPGAAPFNSSMEWMLHICNYCIRVQWYWSSSFGPTLALNTEWKEAGHVYIMIREKKASDLHVQQNSSWYPRATKSAKYSWKKMVSWYATNTANWADVLSILNLGVLKTCMFYYGKVYMILRRLYSGIYEWKIKHFCKYPQRYQRYGTGHKYLKDISKGTKISKMWREAQRSQRYGAGHKDLKDMARGPKISKIWRGAAWTFQDVGPAQSPVLFSSNWNLILYGVHYSLSSRIG